MVLNALRGGGAQDRFCAGPKSLARSQGSMGVEHIRLADPLVTEVEALLQKRLSSIGAKKRAKVYARIADHLHARGGTVSRWSVVGRTFALVNVGLFVFLVWRIWHG